MSPLSWMYATAVAMRRSLFDGLKLRQAGPLPSWVVGNLHMGGTGKTPMVLFLLDLLAEKNPAVLSRGYGRSTKGFLAVGPFSQADQVGDEPLEIFKASQAPVFVCEKRVEGLYGLHNAAPEAQLAILDDGFQHLPLLASGYLLLSPFNDPFWKQMPLPAGRLREWPEAAKHANAILITKAPIDLTEEQAQEHIQAIQKLQKPVFFFHYSSSEPLNFWAEKAFEPNEPVFAYSGIAQAKNWTPSHWDLAGTWNRKDHAPLGPAEWEELFQRVVKSGARQLVMTRKDAMKLPNSRPQNLPFDLYVVHNEAQILFGKAGALKSLILGG